MLPIMNIVLLIILQQILLAYSFRCNKNLKRKIANDVELNGLFLFSQDHGKSGTKFGTPHC